MSKPHDTDTVKSHDKYGHHRTKLGGNTKRAQVHTVTSHTKAPDRELKLRKMLTLFPTLCLQKSPPRPEWSLPLHLLAC